MSTHDILHGLWEDGLVSLTRFAILNDYFKMAVSVKKDGSLSSVLTTDIKLDAPLCNA